MRTSLRSISLATALTALLCSFSGSALAAGPGKARVLRLAGPLVEAPDPWDLFGLDEAGVFSELIEAIDREAADPSVGTIVAHLGNLRPGLARSRDLAQALRRARARGKRVVAWLAEASPDTLVIATAADEVLMAPEGHVFLPGVRAEVTYLKGLLDTIGVEADIEAMGRYKSAPEPLLRSDMSADAREALEALVDDLYTTLQDDLARNRRLPPKRVGRLFDRGLLTAEEAKKLDLVDGLSYWPELLDRLETAAGARPTLAWPDAPELPDLSSFFGLLDLLTRRPDQARGGDARVALLVAEGPIVLGRQPDDLLGGEALVAADELIRAIRQVAEDDTVDAVVVRIDSPGGSALASDLIWRELRQLDERVPVVASLGNVAASGGYYLASAARRIVAAPSTLTGSIGVFGGKLVLRGLYDKLGVTTAVVSRGPHAGLFSSLSRFSDGEREVLRRMMRHTYDTFVNRVARGRNMSYDAVDRVAQGRVWSGRAAMAKGLVDSMGGLHEAVVAAARLAEVDPAAVQLVRYPEPRSFMEMLQHRPTVLRAPALSLSTGLAALLPPAVVERALRAAGLVRALLSREQVIAMSPWLIELH